MAVSLIVSCKNKPEGEAAQTGEASETTAKPSDAAKSYQVSSGKVFWAATKVGGGHNGEFTVSRGKLTAENGVVSSGIFEIDITSMTETNLEGESNTKFISHMQSSDFLDTEKFDKGQFTIVSIEPLEGNPDANYTVKGNLELKGISKSISIPANVAVMDNKISVITPKFTINRTEWDIKYGSGVIGTAADKIIHDDVSLNIQLEAVSR